MIKPEIKKLVRNMNDEMKNAMEEFESGSMEFLTHMLVASNLSEIARDKCLIMSGEEAVTCDNFVVDSFEQSIKPLANKLETLMKRVQ
jgi:hypothetical protein